MGEGDRNDPGDGRTCFIKGFDTSMDEDSLKESLSAAFGEYGSIERIGLPFDRENQCLKGFGFVVFNEANGSTVRPPNSVVSGLGRWDDWANQVLVSGLVQKVFAC